MFGQFKQTHQKVSLHLIEMSPAMSRLQEETLTGGETPHSLDLGGGEVGEACVYGWISFMGRVERWC